MDECYAPKPCYIEQTLKVSVPEALWTALVYGTFEVRSHTGYIGTTVEVKYPSDELAGTLVYFPGVGQKALL